MPFDKPFDRLSTSLRTSLSNALLSDIREFVEALDDEAVEEETDWFSWATDLIRRVHKETDGVSDESETQRKAEETQETESPRSDTTVPPALLRTSLSQCLAPLEHRLRFLSQQMELLVAETKRPSAPYVTQTRLLFPNVQNPISTPKDFYEHVFQTLKDLPQEHVVLVCLNTKNVPIHTEIVYKGTTNCAVYHPRDLFRIAAQYNAVSIAVCHTHPSGDPTPSSEDLGMTKRVAECGRLLDIPLLDHLILGKERYVALTEIHPELFPKRALNPPTFLKGD